MAATRPTPLTLHRKVSLCLMLLFSPRKFRQEEDSDNACRHNFTDQGESAHRSILVRDAFLKSLLGVLISGTIGYALGELVHSAGRCATQETTNWLQISSASLLLWATIFIRGWEIQTYSGATLTEQVN